MTPAVIRKLAADEGVTETGAYTEWLEERLLVHETVMEGRTGPAEWPGWKREQYAELCENAEAWMDQSPRNLPWSIRTSGQFTRLVFDNAKREAVVWRGMDNGSYTSPSTAEYILRAVNFFPMALWAAVQHNNDAAACWRYCEKIRVDGITDERRLERAVAALHRLVAAARKAEIDHSTVFTVDDGAIAAALDVLAKEA